MKIQYPLTIKLRILAVPLIVPLVPLNRPTVWSTRSTKVNYLRCSCFFRRSHSRDPQHLTLTLFLNTLALSFPVSLTTDDLKSVLPVIIRYNLEAPCLCINTKLIVKQHVVMQTVVKQTHRQKTVEAINLVLSPRIPLISTGLPFTFRRLQIPLKFLKSIKNSQGQIFKQQARTKSPRELFW